MGGQMGLFMGASIITMVEIVFAACSVLKAVFLKIIITCRYWLSKMTSSRTSLESSKQSVGVVS